VLRRLPSLALAALALGAGACGDDEKSTEQAGTTATGATAPSAAPTATARTTPRSQTPGAQDLTRKPAIAKPTGAPPPRLKIDDLVPGTGPAAKPGDRVSVQYVGVSFKTGQEFDASWDRGQPFDFQLGTGGVIPGWDQGVAGMKVGGRRRLTIPPNLAYGAQGAPPAIGPNETLVFVIDLLRVG